MSGAFPACCGSTVVSGPSRFDHVLPPSADVQAHDRVRATVVARSSYAAAPVSLRATAYWLAKSSTATAGAKPGPPWCVRRTSRSNFVAPGRRSWPVCASADGTAASPKRLAAVSAARIRMQLLAELLGLGRPVVLQDVEATLVVDRVDELLGDPVGRRLRAREGLEPADVVQLALAVDHQELRAVLVRRHRDDAAVLEVRLRLEPVAGAAEAVDRRVAVGVHAVLVGVLVGLLE